MKKTSIVMHIITMAFAASIVLPFAISACMTMLDNFELVEIKEGTTVIWWMLPSMLGFIIFSPLSFIMEKVKNVRTAIALIIIGIAALLLAGNITLDFESPAWVMNFFGSEHIPVVSAVLLAVSILLLSTKNKKAFDACVE